MTQKNISRYPECKPAGDGDSHGSVSVSSINTTSWQLSPTMQHSDVISSIEASSSTYSTPYAPTQATEPLNGQYSTSQGNGSFQAQHDASTSLAGHQQESISYPGGIMASHEQSPQQSATPGSYTALQLQRPLDPNLTINGTPKQPGVFEHQPASLGMPRPAKQPKLNTLVKSENTAKGDGKLRTRSKTGCLTCRKRRVKVSLGIYFHCVLLCVKVLFSIFILTCMLL